MNDYTIATAAGMVIAEVSHHDITNDTASPYDTGARLEPHPWVQDGITGSESPRAAEADDYGRVDFDDDEGTTIATVHIEGSATYPEQAFILKIDVNAPVIIHGPGGEYIGTVQPM